MFKAIGAALLSILSIFNPSWSASQVIDHTTASILRVRGEADFDTIFGPMHGSYTCTAFMIAEHRALTAAHCAGDNMTTDGIPAEVLGADKDADLALLFVENDKPALQLADHVDRLQDVVAVGYGNAYAYPWITFSKVILVDYRARDFAAKGIFVSVPYVHGMSGGPVVDYHGRIVSMVQDAVEGAGFGVNADTMRAFLGIYL